MKTPEQIAEQVRHNYLGLAYDEIIPMDGAAVERALIEAIEADRAQRNPYLLSFEPDAIRDHFDVDECDPTEGMTDEQLEAVALDALQDDRLYAVFHELLSEGVGA